jgi:hypothetical protein
MEGSGEFVSGGSSQGGVWGVDAGGVGIWGVHTMSVLGKSKPVMTQKDKLDRMSVSLFGQKALHI